MLTTGLGVIMVALWLGLIGGAVPTAHADPDAGNTGHSTSQSAKHSDKAEPHHTRLGPRKHKAPRGEPPAQEPPTRALPTPAQAREMVEGFTTQVRTALADAAQWAPKARAVKPLPRTRSVTVRERRVVPETVSTADAANVAEHPTPDVAEVADPPGAVTRPADAPPPARAATLVDQVATQARTALTDIADRASNRSTVAASSTAIPAAAVSAPVPMARSVPLVNIVGSLVFNVVGAALQVFSGPPVLPPGSTVTVRTSTLEMPGSDQTVRADWYFPEDPDSATGVIYLQHGFMATGPMYSYTAAHLAEETNSIVVVPSLSSNLFDPDGEWIGGEPMQQSVADLFAGDRAELTASASAAAGQPVALPSKFVLVGHSLGGMLVVGAAGRMVDNGAVDDLAGVVLLDAVDTHGDMPAALDALSGANPRPVLLISSERYVWNRDGLVGDELQAARPGQFNGVMLVGGRHIDGLQGANPILQFAEYAIAGFSQPQNIAAARAISAGWINDMYAGGEDGVYGAPGQSIDIPTPSGTASAVVLPFPSTEPVTATPWDGLVGPILDGLFRYAVYEPLAGRSVAVAV